MRSPYMRISALGALMAVAFRTTCRAMDTANDYASVGRRDSLLITALGLSGSVLHQIDEELAARGFIHVIASAYPPLVIPGNRQSKSKSFLVQEAFVRMTTILFDLGYLPITESNLSPAARGWGLGRNSMQFDESCISRRAFINFFSNRSSLVPHGSNCLFWDNTRYRTLFSGRCPKNQAWTFTYRPDNGVPTVADVNDRLRSIKGDMNSMADVAYVGTAAERFDLLVINQVCEHVARPFSGALAAAHLLREGGLLFFTAPFLERYHRVPATSFVTRSRAQLNFSPRQASRLLRRIVTATRLRPQGISWGLVLTILAQTAYKELSSSPRRLLPLTLLTWTERNGCISALHSSSGNRSSPNTRVEQANQGTSEQPSFRNMFVGCSTRGQRFVAYMVGVISEVIERRRAQGNRAAARC